MSRWLQTYKKEKKKKKGEEETDNTIEYAFAYEIYKAAALNSSQEKPF